MSPILSLFIVDILCFIYGQVEAVLSGTGGAGNASQHQVMVGGQVMDVVQGNAPVVPPGSRLVLLNNLGPANTSMLESGRTLTLLTLTLDCTGEYH